MVSNQSERSSISLSQQTKQALDSIKHPGQSYDGLIKELVKFWEEKKEGTGLGDKSKNAQ